MKIERSFALVAGLCLLAVLLLSYWVFGPHELAPWRTFADLLDGNLGAMAKKAQLAKATPAQQQILLHRWQHQEDPSIVDKPSLPVLVQSFFEFSRSGHGYDEGFEDVRWSENLDAPDARMWPASGAERAFTRFLAIDAVAAAVLAL